MQYPVIVKLVLEKGIDNIKVPGSIKGPALTEAGQVLAKERRYEEAGKAFFFANNTRELLEAGDWLAQQGRFKDASYFFRYSNDKQRMETCAHGCIDQNQYTEALALFRASNNENMITFMRENFGV